MRLFVCVLLFLSIFFLPTRALAQCGASVTWSVSPPLPPNGIYPDGITIELCLTINSYFSGGATWFSGAGVIAPPIWTDLTGSQAPSSCGIDGEWIFVDGVTCQGLSIPPGYYHDSNHGGVLDGSPCNNFGDPCASSGENFCFQMTLSSDNSTSESINISPSIVLYNDGTVGSWATPSCGGLILNTPFSIYNNPCQVNPGLSPGEVVICDEGEICLFDLLEEPKDEGGVWSGPNNWQDSECGIFSPLANSPGVYTYTVEDDSGCSINSEISLIYNDLGVLGDFGICEVETINLFEYDFMEGFPSNGLWYYPSNNGELVEVPSGILFSDSDPSGIYQYRYTESDCWGQFSIQFNFDFVQSEEQPSYVEVDFCIDIGEICPIELFPTDVIPGGTWVLYDSNFEFIDFESEYDFCQDMSILNQQLLNFEEGFYYIYTINTFPCPASPDTLKINLIETQCGSSVNGSVVLNQSCLPFGITLDFYLPETTVLVESISSFIDQEGNFSISANLENGNYDIYVKVDNHLSTGIYNFPISSTGVTLTISELKPGDVNNDDLINFLDGSSIGPFFGSAFGEENYSLNADVNCDGLVNFLDGSLIGVFFGDSGEEP